MQVQGRFTVEQIPSNVSACIALILGQCVFVLSIYVILLLLLLFPRPLFYICAPHLLFVQKQSKQILRHFICVYYGTFSLTGLSGEHVSFSEEELHLLLRCLWLKRLLREYQSDTRIAVMSGMFSLSTSLGGEFDILPTVLCPKPDGSLNLIGCRA